MLPIPSWFPYNGMNPQHFKFHCIPHKNKYYVTNYPKQTIKLVSGLSKTFNNLWIYMYKWWCDGIAPFPSPFYINDNPHFHLKKEINA